MQIMAKPDGTTTIVKPDRIYKGSNNVTELTFVAPFPSSDVVTAAFTLPDTTIVDVGVLANAASVQYGDLILNAWAATIPSSVTAQVGRVGVSFSVVSGKGVTTTFNNGFEVEYSGFPSVQPDPPPDVYELILQMLAQTKAAVSPIKMSGSAEVTAIPSETDPYATVSVTPEEQSDTSYAYRFGFDFGLPKGDPGPPGPSVAAGMTVVPVTPGKWQADPAGGYFLTVDPDEHRMGATPNILVFSAEKDGDGYARVNNGYTVTETGVVTMRSYTAWDGLLWFCGGIAPQGGQG